MNYQEFLSELKSFADSDYKDFHKRLLKNDDLQVLGVRIPQLRKLAKKYKICVDEFMSFPDDYYEVTFVKLTIVSLLEWESFIKYIDKCVSLIDNWATCDCFTPICVKKHKKEFLCYIFKYSENNGEYYQRFALTSLLHFYVDEEYLNTIFEVIKKSDTSFYYVHMAAAWLVAEVLVKYFDDGAKFLLSGVLDKKTHNKAIQKACESFRLNAEQKTYLKGLKI